MGNKVVSLTKVKKKPRDDKDKHMQEIRKQLRPGKIICAKNKVMQLALGTTAAQECQDNIHKIATRITGHCCLLFTDKEPVQVQKIFSDYRPIDYARSGALATSTVKLSKGTDALAKL